jgi:hypothetical protein
LPYGKPNARLATRNVPDLEKVERRPEHKVRLSNLMGIHKALRIIFASTIAGQDDQEL